MLSRNEGEGCSLKDLDIEHYTAFERSLRRMLDTDVAERAYSEVFDGMPLRDSYLDLQFPEDRHPALKHVNLSEGVRERVFDFRSKFDLSSLWFETSVGNARSPPEIL